MTTTAVNLKRVQELGTGIMCMLAVLSIMFYLERGTFMDVAFQTFEMVRTRELAPQVYRFGSAFTQIFPLMAIGVYAPLWVVALMYSLGVVLYQSALFYYIAFIQKNSIISVAFLISLLLIQTHTFFWIQSEFTQSIPFGFAVLAYIEGFRKKPFQWWHFPIVMACITTAVFFHPLQMPLLLLLSIMMMVQQGGHKIYTLSLALLVLTWAVKKNYFSNWYDNMAGERMAELNNIDARHWLTPGMKNFISEVAYIGLPVLLLLVTYLAIKQKQVLKGFLITGITIAYFLFIHWTHPQADVFYVENLLLGIPAILGLAFALLVHTIASHPSRIWLQTVLSGCALFFALRMMMVVPYYQKRLAIYDQLMTTYKGQKIMLSPSALPRPYMLFAWPSAYEVWMLSTIKHHKTASLCFRDDTSKYVPTLPLNKQFRGIRNYPYDALKAPYFIWSDTLSTYKIN